MESFIKLFNADVRGIIEMFFTSKIICYDDYFLFICIFMFFDNESKLSLLESIARINSNVSISKEQIFYFFDKIKMPKILLEDLFNDINDHKINQSCNGQIYYLKAFNTYLLSSRVFKTLFILIQTKIPEIVDYEIISSISDKIEHYYNKKIGFQNLLNVDNCVVSMKRFFGTIPPKFHSDYSVNNISDDSFVKIVFMIKQEYGYSARYSSIRSSRNFTSQLNVKKSVQFGISSAISPLSSLKENQ